MSAVGTDPGLCDGLERDTVRAIADEVWVSLVGEEEPLVDLPAQPLEGVSAWVTVDGPWSGAVVITCAPATAEQLTRSLLRLPEPQALDGEDVTDAMGELANVLGGSVKAVLPGPSVLGLPHVAAAARTGDGPAGPPGSGACRVDVGWRGRPVTITVQAGATAARPAVNHQHDSNGVEQ